MHSIFAFHLPLCKKPKEVPRFSGQRGLATCQEELQPSAEKLGLSLGVGLYQLCSQHCIHPPVQYQEAWTNKVKLEVMQPNKVTKCHANEAKSIYFGPNHVACSKKTVK